MADKLWTYQDVAEYIQCSLSTAYKHNEGLKLCESAQKNRFIPELVKNYFEKKITAPLKPDG